MPGDGGGDFGTVGCEHQLAAAAAPDRATQIIIGKSTRTRWFEIVHGSVVHDLVRRAGNISVHVIAGEAVAGEPVPKKVVKP